MIENRHTYAKLKILRSLFSKRKQRPFHVKVFMTKLEKYKYDNFISKFPRTGNGYAKRNRKILEHLEDMYHLPEPVANSVTLRNNERPITLTYYLED